MSGVRSAPALLPASGFLKTAAVATRRSGGLVRAPYSALISSTNVTVLRNGMGPGPCGGNGKLSASALREIAGDRQRRLNRPASPGRAAGTAGPRMDGKPRDGHPVPALHR